MKITDLLAATAIATAISAAGSLLYAAPLLAGAVLCALTIRAVAHRMLGGVTGDVLGATNEICEVFVLALAATLANHPT
jgi:adenosylcobinamide-GDP ribazoletransferase